MPKPWGSSRAFALGLVLACLCAASAGAHDGRRPHHFVLQHVRAVADSVVVTVWVERPTPAVVAEFESMFRDEPERAAEQDTSFREAQWSHLTGALRLEVDGRPFEGGFVPADLPNNGRGNEDFFVYVLRVSIPVADAAAVRLRLVDEAFLGDHVFFSNYTETGEGWLLVEDSASSSTGDVEVGHPQAPGALWSHDPSLRDWNLRLRRTSQVPRQ